MILRHGPRSVVVLCLEAEKQVAAIGGPRRIPGEQPAVAALADGYHPGVATEPVLQADPRRSRRRKVAIGRPVRTLLVVDGVDQLGQQEVEIGVAVAVRMGRHVDRHAVDPGREVGTVIEIEAAEEVLVGLAVTRMLGHDDAGDVLEHFGRPQWRTRLEQARVDPSRRGGVGRADGVVVVAGDFDRLQYDFGLRPGRRPAGRAGGCRRALAIAGLGQRRGRRQQRRPEQRCPEQGRREPPGAPLRLQRASDRDAAEMQHEGRRHHPREQRQRPDQSTRVIGVERSGWRQRAARRSLDAVDEAVQQSGERDHGQRAPPRRSRVAGERKDHGRERDTDLDRQRHCLGRAGHARGGAERQREAERAWQPPAAAAGELHCPDADRDHGDQVIGAVERVGQTALEQRHPVHRLLHNGPASEVLRGHVPFGCSPGGFAAGSPLPRLARSARARCGRSKTTEMRQPDECGSRMPAVRGCYWNATSAKLRSLRECS